MFCWLFIKIFLISILSGTIHDCSGPRCEASQVWDPVLGQRAKSEGYCVTRSKYKGINSFFIHQIFTELQHM